MKIKNKKFVDNIPKSSAFCFGIAVGAGVIGLVALRDIRGLEIIDINLIHDVAQDVDFLCVAHANGTFQNLLFEFNPR